jgi:uncharacterized protein YebE (UPF0316 family)
MLYPNNEKNKDFVSIIIIASEIPYSEFNKTIENLHQYLDLNFVDFEIVIIEDEPHSLNVTQLQLLLENKSSLRVIQLSFKLGYEVAVTVGLENSIGDYVVVLNQSLDPLDVIHSMVSQCKTSDVDVVVGVADNVKKSIGYKMIRPFAKIALKEIGYEIPKDASNLRCLSRTAVNSATKARNYHHQIFVRIAQSGVKSSSFIYSVNNIDKLKKTLTSSIGNTFSLLVFNSTKPLRWMSGLGFMGSFFALMFATYSFITRLINDNIADGWSSLVILISILFMLLFVILSFFGEYIARLLNEQSRHEPYWITNEKHSSVMVNSDRPNVISESEIINFNKLEKP